MLCKRTPHSSSSAKTTRHQIPNLETSTRISIFFSILPYALIALKCSSHSPKKYVKKTWNQRCQQLGSSQSLDTGSAEISSKHFQYLAEDAWPLCSKFADADLHFCHFFANLSNIVHKSPPLRFFRPRSPQGTSSGHHPKNPSQPTWQKEKTSESFPGCISKLD